MNIRQSIAGAMLLASLAGAGGAAAAEPAGEATAEEHFHRNWAAVFVGITGQTRRKKEPAIGLEYARHLTPEFSIGGIAEYTFGESDFLVLAIPFAYGPDPWKFYIAPGLEDADFKGSGEFLMRVGAEYAFEAGEWEIAPQLDVDFVDGEQVFILGVTLGRTF